MEIIVSTAIKRILENHKDLMRIPLRQRSKFEGWLKFELAHELSRIGMTSVEVESKKYFNRSRSDISFFHGERYFSLELKTANTSWKCNGSSNCNRPISKNIYSVIDDVVKLNSSQGIAAFVLFPIPLNDYRWEFYIDRIANTTSLEICKKNNCTLVEMNIDDTNKCNVLISVFRSKHFPDHEKWKYSKY